MQNHAMPLSPVPPVRQAPKLPPALTALAALLRAGVQLGLTLVLASALIFASLELLPGHAAALMLGPDAAPDAVLALSRELGLDQPAWQRYGQWMAGLLHGELGDSYAYRTPVGPMLAERLRLSLPLSGLALALTVLASLGLGLLAAARRGRWVDHLLLALSQLGLALPAFWFGMGLMWLFAVRLQWLPAGGFPGWEAELGGGWGPALQALLLPALALALTQTALLARLLRASLLDVLQEDYVLAARARGLPERRVLLRHALRNALVPVLTQLGTQFAALLAGAVLIETLFQLPGLGQLIAQAIANRDLVVVRNAVMALVAMVLAVNAAVDLLNTWLDPRLRRPEASHG